MQRRRPCSLICGNFSLRDAPVFERRLCGSLAIENVQCGSTGRRGCGLRFQHRRLFAGNQFKSQCRTRTENFARADLQRGTKFPLNPIQQEQISHLDNQILSSHGEACFLIEPVIIASLSDRLDQFAEDVVNCGFHRTDRFHHLGLHLATPYRAQQSRFRARKAGLTKRHPLPTNSNGSGIIETAGRFDSRLGGGTISHFPIAFTHSVGLIVPTCFPESKPKNLFLFLTRKSDDPLVSKSFFDLNLQPSIQP